MIYADYGYYQIGYLNKETGLICEEDFALYAKKASIHMDCISSGRITGSLAQNERIKDCCCEMAEQLYRFEKARENESGAPVASWSNDGESGTYDLSESGVSESAHRKKMAQIARMYLLQLGLLYRGC